ncbi:MULTISPECIES: hypothetical protein [Sphingobacterium]|uniref:DUF4397 domain-containing protein n=1 Tax=Sphingobacterium kitahiroshimense TaxID=470446 RepID=A0ABV0C480_9SPHI|nr:hypothetical protein [Sphingobacterium sp. JUb56]MBB2952506.1 hypothetical protein [Sphingobacterium sp. JUb56]
MLKKLFIYFIVLWTGCALYSCQKGEIVEDQRQLARVAFKSYSGENLGIKKISIDGEFTNYDGPKDSYLFIFDKSKDTSVVIAFGNEDKIVLKQRLALKSGSNIFGVYPKSPLDPTLVVGKNPLEGAQSDATNYQIKILNYNKIISPDGEPVRLAIYSGTLVFDENTFEEKMVYAEEPILTTDLITDQIPDNFIKIPVAIPYYRATVLDKDSKPLLINGQQVFLFLRLAALGSDPIALIYLPQKDPDVIFEDDWVTFVDGLGFELSNVWLKK